MSDIYNRSLPFSQDQFRQTTEKMSAPGIGFVPKKDLCQGCKKHRSAATGTYTRKGFVCNQCGKYSTAKSAAKSADAKTAASSVR